jgi:hypothetical protein
MFVEGEAQAALPVPRYGARAAGTRDRRHAPPTGETTPDHKARA